MNYAVIRRKRPSGTEDFAAIVTYILAVGEAPADELHDLFAQVGPDAEEIYMTTAEMFRAEGRAEVLVQILTLKFGPLPKAVLDLVHTASSDQLQTFTPRVLTANTLDDVLR